MIQDMPEDMESFVRPLAAQIAKVLEDYWAFLQAKNYDHANSVILNTLVNLSASTFVALCPIEEADDFIEKFRGVIYKKAETMTSG